MISRIWTSRGVFDSGCIEVHPVETALRFENPKVVLPDYLKVNEVDVDGMRHAIVGVDDEPILDITNLGVLTLPRMEVSTAVDSKFTSSINQRSHSLHCNLILVFCICQIEIGDTFKSETLDRIWSE